MKKTRIKINQTQQIMMRMKNKIIILNIMKKVNYIIYHPIIFVINVNYKKWMMI